MKCILIYLLIVCGGFGSEVLALRCASPDGLSVDEVRRVVKKCMKKVIDDDYQEYENFDDDYEMPSRPDHSASNSQTNSRNDNNRGNSNGPSYNQQTGPHYEPQAGGNYYGSNTKNNRRDHFNSYQFTYNNNNQLNGNRNQNNDGHRNDSSDKHERDQSCILQCFFQELKMTNNEGFPDKHKALHVLTKEIRDRELKDFYTDSIQECFRMMDVDPKQHRDNCLYAKTLIACLADRAKMNCADWDGDTVIF